MSGIRGTNTRPEIAVRRYLHVRGFRYRLHAKNLPGKPDIVLPKYRTVILVHGCYWHRHEGCRYATTPSTRRDFWLKKFQENVERDRRIRRKLKSLGWRVLVIWECEIDSDTLDGLVNRILSDNH